MGPWPEHSIQVRVNEPLQFRATSKQLSEHILKRNDKSGVVYMAKVCMVTSCINRTATVSKQVDNDL